MDALTRTRIVKKILEEIETWDCDELREYVLNDYRDYLNSLSDSDFEAEQGYRVNELED